jgi:hypothetical protein
MVEQEEVTKIKQYLKMALVGTNEYNTPVT